MIDWLARNCRLGKHGPYLTGGKDPRNAKTFGRAGWSYAQHLCVDGLAVHGDTGRVETTRRAWSDWLDSLGPEDDAGRK
jgi:hypothetical protein